MLALDCREEQCAEAGTGPGAALHPPGQRAQQPPAAASSRAGCSLSCCHPPELCMPTYCAHSSPLEASRCAARTRCHASRDCGRSRQRSAQLPRCAARGRSRTELWLGPLGRPALPGKAGSRLWAAPESGEPRPASAQAAAPPAAPHLRHHCAVGAGVECGQRGLQHGQALALAQQVEVVQGAEQPRVGGEGELRAGGAGGGRGAGG